MFMLIRTSRLAGSEIGSSEITPESAFLSGRREFLSKMGTMAAGGAVTGMMPRRAFADDAKLTTVPGKFQATDAQTPFAKATSYNNFYEFGIPKDQPAKNAHTLKTRPWTVQVSGLVKKPLTVGIDDLMHFKPLESRVYRHRCVEAWSMVIPWDGYSLSEFINFCEPLPSAKYVQFISNLNRQQMPELTDQFDWPYSEGLRMDEAMHPLTMLTFGCYGQALPNQNGAPVRVTVPWKYGYKSPKSIVKVIFKDKQPSTLWNDANPPAYGFYSNVNPDVDTVPWSQKHERRIDSSLLPRSVETQIFNGYGDQVAGLYSGMDLKRYY
jgi:sulfoxide reductase catalytic subunit YedY